MPKIITPTVGRRLHYWPSADDLVGANEPPMQSLNPAVPMDAGVVFVHNDRCVNLIVTDHRGNTSRRMFVPLVQEGDVYVAEAARCEWMDYQRSQADKHAAQPAKPLLLEGAEHRHPENKEFADALQGRALLLRVSGRPLTSTQADKARVILHHIDGLLSALNA